MRKVRLIVLKSHIEGLVRDLHTAGLVDIRDTRFQGLEEGRPLPSFDDISAELLKLRRALSMMEAVVGTKKASEPEIIDGTEALEQARNLGFDQRLEELSRESASLSESIRGLESQAMTIDRILHFKGVDFSKLRTRTLDYRVGEMPMSKHLQLAEALEKTLGHTALISEPGCPAVLAVYEKKGERDVDTVLADMGFSDIELPEGITTPVETIERVNSENESRKKALRGAKAEIARISKDRIHTVRSLVRSLEIESQRAEIAQRFSSSKCIYVIEGWILQEKMAELEKLAARYSDVVIEDAPFGHDEHPPVVLDNPKQAHPIEFLTQSYSLPNYFEMDPTLPYFIGLPIIYGMIVGDVMYGFASIGIGYLLMKKFSKSYMMSNISKIWFLSGFPTIIFGMLYDEWAGMSHINLLNFLGSWVGIAVGDAPFYEGFHRMAHIFELVVLTVMVGVIHLAFGFILGAINEWGHSKKHALAKVAWLGVEVGMVLALVGAVGVLEPSFMMAGLVVLVLSIIGLVMTEGAMGIIELPGLVGNILSYTRIAAIGIVGVVIAELINQFLMPNPSQGLMAIVLIPVFFVLHISNAFLAMFEALVQGGRLNIVEFRSKFLRGGGQPFDPFRMR